MLGINDRCGSRKNLKLPQRQHFFNQFHDFVVYSLKNFASHPTRKPNI
jgi:hypothetical protein